MAGEIRAHSFSSLDLEGLNFLPWRTYKGSSLLLPQYRYLPGGAHIRLNEPNLQLQNARRVIACLGMSIRSYADLLEQQDKLAARLQSLHELNADVVAKHAAEAVGRQRASVLVALFEGRDGDIWVWLTERSAALRSHAGSPPDFIRWNVCPWSPSLNDWCPFRAAGEVALPGGKHEQDDPDTVATGLRYECLQSEHWAACSRLSLFGGSAPCAYREAHEEIGLDPATVRVLGTLPPSLSKAGIIVTAVLALVPSTFCPVVNADEVSEAFATPLSVYLSSECHQARKMEWLGLRSLLHYFEYRTSNGSAPRPLAAWTSTDVVESTERNLPQRPPVSTQNDTGASRGALPDASRTEANPAGGEAVRFSNQTCDRTYLIWGLTAQVLIVAAQVVYERVPPFPVDSYPRMLLGSAQPSASASVGIRGKL